jgi:hypothetical protein
MKSLDPTPYLDQFPAGSSVREFKIPEEMEGEDIIGLCVPMQGPTGQVIEQYFFMMHMDNMEEFFEFQKSRTLIIGFHSNFVPVFSIGALGLETEQENNNNKLQGDPNTNWHS